MKDFLIDFFIGGVTFSIIISILVFLNGLLNLETPFKRSSGLIISLVYSEYYTYKELFVLGTAFLIGLGFSGFLLYKIFIVLGKFVGSFIL